ncbi:hypothetical protein LZ30DRAFT_706104 [Colletotrichum cereale]|nr:hypothetical protein LZ30DRAFT_706104 [Colletotrichum cereale]
MGWQGSSRLASLRCVGASGLPLINYVPGPLSRIAGELDDNGQSGSDGQGCSFWCRRPFGAVRLTKCTEHVGVCLSDRRQTGPLRSHFEHREPMARRVVAGSSRRGELVDGGVADRQISCSSQGRQQPPAAGKAIGSLDVGLCLARPKTGWANGPLTVKAGQGRDPSCGASLRRLVVTISLCKLRLGPARLEGNCPRLREGESCMYHSRRLPLVGGRSVFFLRLSVRKYRLGSYGMVWYGIVSYRISLLLQNSRLVMQHDDKVQQKQVKRTWAGTGVLYTE